MVKKPLSPRAGSLTSPSRALPRLLSAVGADRAFGQDDVASKREAYLTSGLWWSGRSSLGSDPIKLEQIDWKKDHVQENNGIDMCEQAVETKQNIARKRDHSERNDGSHAKACKNSERCTKSKAIDPGHGWARAGWFV
jgi:hypothetical protein